MDGGYIIQEPPFALPLNSIVHGRYLINRVLGVGGFGITYQGQNLETKEFVAIKEFYPNNVVSRNPGQFQVEITGSREVYEKQKEKFLQEARIIYHLKSRYLLTIYSLFEENGTAYYVMEFLEGRDLKHYLDSQGGQIKWRDLKPITLQIMEALEIVHAENIIHRDISPDNIYLSANGCAKLIDFGTARDISRNKSLSVILKKGYAPPEQYMSHGKQGPWTDIYALGGTIYKCLTGKMPVESVERTHDDTLEPIERYATDVPADVCNAIMKAMQLKEENRFRTVKEFKEAISGFANRKGKLISWLGASKKNVSSITENFANQIFAWAKFEPALYGASGIYGGQKFMIDSDIIMGRDSSRCNIVFPPDAKDVSRVHCQILKNVEGRTGIIDCGSTYGTFINSYRLIPGQLALLQSGTEIKLGKFNSFYFQV